MRVSGSWTAIAAVVSVMDVGMARGAGILPGGPIAFSTGSVWDGFASLESMFVFGDSYTATGFSPTGTQPSPSNPLGNPGYPGATSSNGPNWVDYLAVEHNESTVLVYNLAVGGASIDTAVIPSPIEPVVSMRRQVEEVFNVYYAPSNSSTSWDSARTLFAFWIGINDVDSAYLDPDWNSLMSRAVDVYADLTKELYNAGARNFLFLAVPPLQLAPMIKDGGASNVAASKAAVVGFNEAVKDTVATGLKDEYGDEATAWWFDTNELFTNVIADPTQYPETSAFVNTTTYCEAYVSGTPEPDTFDPSCEAPVNEYFWLNTLHATAPVHELIARLTAEMLEAGPTV